jgi:transcriptional regulator with XRE-family HTH domain
MQAAKPAITGAQIRAARAFLNWSVRDLAERCGVSESAISRAEKVNDIPGMQRRNIEAIRMALESQGIEFINSSGLKIHRRDA